MRKTMIDKDFITLDELLAELSEAVDVLNEYKEYTNSDYVNLTRSILAGLIHPHDVIDTRTGDVRKSDVKPT